MRLPFRSHRLLCAAVRRFGQSWIEHLRSELKIVVFTKDTMTSVVYDDELVLSVVSSDVISDRGVERMLWHIGVEVNFLARLETEAVEDGLELRDLAMVNECATMATFWKYLARVSIIIVIDLRRPPNDQRSHLNIAVRYVQFLLDCILKPGLSLRFLLLLIISRRDCTRIVAAEIRDKISSSEDADVCLACRRERHSIVVRLLCTHCRGRTQLDNHCRRSLAAYLWRNSSIMPSAQRRRTSSSGGYA